MGDLQSQGLAMDLLPGLVHCMYMYITKNPELLSRVLACSESSVENVKTLMFACSALWSTGYKG